ncbi:hypothetical protein IEQ34_022473 [Dendrobium chrysotoxum]|uniref:Uncharacterized protein n=1 Tax=Dendrobium chrysotoxum TaxID=161865 RepID=A0AAV7FZ47_DENCH|nr:hypothetical protein IEQ34_022473 [Dendrobium chrysotoxum]
MGVNFKLGTKSSMKMDEQNLIQNSNVQVFKNVNLIQRQNNPNSNTYNLDDPFIWQPAKKGHDDNEYDQEEEEPN